MTAARITLASMLRRGHLRVALVALLTVGIVLSASSFLVLRATVAHNLDLLARSVTYTGEAAVLFQDRDAAKELLSSIAQTEHLARAEIFLPNGTSLAEVERNATVWHEVLARAIGDRLFPLEVSSSITHEQQLIGTVLLRGDSRVFVRILGEYLVGGLVCMLLTAVAVVVFSRRLERDIVRPLGELTHLTRSIRSTRAFERRAPPSEVAEIQDLSDDFNAMLDEVQAHESELIQRHDRLQLDNESLSFMATHDALTGLANRAHFENKLNEAIAMAHDKGTGVGLLYLDADRFKAVNDQHGHSVGDRLLVEVAARIRRQVRESDLVGRLGGDEFAVLLYPLRDVAHAHAVRQKIHVSMSEPLEISGGGTLVPSMSVGVAAFPANGTSAETLLAAADEAMYQVKKGAPTARPTERLEKRGSP